MAQLVFVHGVANRDSPNFRASIANRDKLFQELLFNSSNVKIHSPFWGQHVPSIPEDVFKTNASVGAYALGAPGALALGSGLQEVENDADGLSVDIVNAGKQDPITVLDAICSEMIDRAEIEDRELSPEEISAIRLAADLIENESAEGVFHAAISADSVTEILSSKMQKSLGIGSAVGDAVTAVSDRIRNSLSKLGYGAVRDELGPAVGLFFGDVFVYLKEGDGREKIRNEIRSALIGAHSAAKAEGGPLIVIGHSMGGVILVDMLTDHQDAGLPDDLHLDALLTVGSQPGLFAALDVISTGSEKQRKRPDCVSHWINVFDPIDPLAFRTDMIFQNVSDLRFSNGTGIVQAHSKYFQRPQFYARSRKRLRDLGIL